MLKKDMEERMGVFAASNDTLRVRQRQLEKEIRDLRSSLSDSKCEVKGFVKNRDCIVAFIDGVIAVKYPLPLEPCHFNDPRYIPVETPSEEHRLLNYLREQLLFTKLRDMPF